MDKNFNEVVDYLPVTIKNVLVKLNDNVTNTIKEISLRINKPIVITTLNDQYFITESGELKKNLSEKLFIVSKTELQEALRILTEYSLHSYQDEINRGYITISGGHRVGIVGTAVYNEVGKETIKNISSLNIRIARQIKGVSLKLCKEIYPLNVVSTLIIGAPASGKTTMLKDIARVLSNGELGYFIKVSVIDERGELSATSSGEPQNDLGVMTDVLNEYQKGDGMNIALRSMSPKVIIIDEIANETDVKGIIQSINSGVEIIATAHANSIDELYLKPYLKTLLVNKVFKKIVLLSDRNKPCEVVKIVTPKELMTC